MTPKEKATDLMIRYCNFKEKGHIFPKTIRKKLALITIKEVIEQWEMIDTYLADFGGKLNPNLEYWQEVKKEINKL